MDIDKKVRVCSLCEGECSKLCYEVQNGDEVQRRDFALAIDEILETILKSLGRSSLFKCRLVSHRWRTMATKIIKRDDMYPLFFYFCTKDEMYIRGYEGEDPSRMFTLQNLSLFMKTNYKTAEASLNVNTFPVKNFIFTQGSLRDPGMLNFLRTYGDHIHNLHLNFSDSSQSQSELEVLQDIDTIIAQVPNLKNLSLRPNLKITAENGDGNSTEVMSYLQLESDRNFKLNVLNVGATSNNILTKLTSCSPNLCQINFDFPDFNWLTKPSNRLHLIRHFKIHSDPANTFNLQKLKMIESSILISPQKRQIQNLPPLNFESLEIDFDVIVAPISENVEIGRCWVKIISRIFEHCYKTLDSISLSNHTADTLKGIKWPRVLPKIRHLSLSPKALGGLEIFLSRGNFKMQETFPKLRSVFIYLSAKDFKNSGGISYLKKGDFEPLCTVKSVFVTAYYENIPRSYYVAEEGSSVPLLQILFPNAVHEINII